jgi:hypothetical protein
MPDPSTPNDYAKLMKPVEEGPGLPDGLPQVEVQHDEGCARHRSGGCDCDPKIKLRAPAQTTPAGIPDVAFFREQGVLYPELWCPSGKSVKLESPVPVAASDRMPMGSV